MGVYIQTATGLKKISGLSYTPAKEEDLKSHINNTDIHVTSEDKSKWDGKADSDHDHDDKYAAKSHTHPDYASKEHTHSFDDLEDKPNIDTDQDDNALIITDANGNIIARIDANGVDSVDLLINGQSILSLIQDSEINVDLSNYYNKTEIDNKIDDKADKDHNHDFNDLENKPNIESNDTDDSLSIIDSNGNIIAKIDKNGINSIDLLIDGVSVKDLINTGGSVDLTDYYTKDQTISEINNAVKDKADAGHNHDETYAAKEHSHSEYSDKDHNHDDSYYTKTEIDNKANLVINTDQIIKFDQTIYNTIKTAIDGGRSVIVVENGIDSYVAYKSDGMLHFANSWGWVDWCDDGTVTDGQYVTSTNVNNYISTYMSENYENGDVNKY